MGSSFLCDLRAAPLGELFVFEYLIDLRPVKANNDRAVHVDHRYAGLAGFFNRGTSIVHVQLNIFVNVFYAQAVKIAHRLVAKRAPFSAINNNFVVHTLKYTIGRGVR